MKEVSCPFCKSAKQTKKLTAWDVNWKVEGIFSLVSCNNCGFIFLSPAPEAHEIEKYYPPRYYTRASGSVEVTESIDQELTKHFSYRHSVLNNFITPPGKLLDVGSGDGHCIAYFNKQGWNVAGAEISDIACKYAVDKLGLPSSDIYCGDFLTVPIPENHFDCITIFDVLEHLQEPDKVLGKCFHLLKPGGGIFVQVPNFNSLGRKLFNKYWIHIDAPRHLHHFTRDSLRKFFWLYKIVDISTATLMRQPYISGYSDSFRHLIKGTVANGNFDNLNKTPITSDSNKSSLRLVARFIERLMFNTLGRLSHIIGAGEMIQLYAIKSK